MKIKYGVIGIVLCLISLSCFAQQQTEHQRLTQIYTQAIQQGNENFNHNPYKISEPFPSANKDKNKKQNDNDKQDSKKKAIPHCNCYDNNDAYNYPSNFYYSKEQQRLKRIQPACICQQSNANEQTPVINSPQTVQTASANDSSDSGSDQNSGAQAGIPSVKVANQATASGGVTGNLSAPASASSDDRNTQSGPDKDNFNFGISYN